MNRNKKLLLPVTYFGKASVIYFCIAWWILINKPVLGFFNNLVVGDNIVWFLNMPINFAYIIILSIITVIWSIIIFSKWEVNDNE